MNLKQTPTSELEAVNYLLVSIGEHQVNSLSDNRSAHVDQARRMLHQTSRQVQSIGLHCNTEEIYPMPTSPTGFGEYEIPVPDNVLRIDASDDDVDVVRRGGRLYDRENHTYKFEETLECDVVWFLEFETLPQVVRDYITIKAGRIYQTKVVGSESLYQFSQVDEEQAYAKLRIQEIDTGDYNILENDDIRRRMGRWH